MNFAFFTELTRDEAYSFLSRYRQEGERELARLAIELESRGGTVDYSTASIRDAFGSVAGQLSTIPTPPDPSLPSWILESETYQVSRYRFAESSYDSVVALSIYFAEVLLREAQGRLHWEIGSPEVAVQNQPCLGGFRNGVQMAPLLVTENLLRRIVETPDPAVLEDVTRAVATWQDLIAA